LSNSYEGKVEVHFDQQCLSKPRKGQWDSIMEYPADLHQLADVLADTKEDRKLSEKPLRVVKVTVTTEVIEIFE